MTTLAALRTQFYQRFDSAQNQYVDNTEADALINESARHLHNWILTEGEFYIFAEKEMALVGNQSDYPLPADFMKILKVFRVGAQPGTFGGRSLLPMQRVMPEEVGSAMAYGSASYQIASCGAYITLGKNLRILPTPGPSTTETIVLWYAPVYTDLVDDADSPVCCVFPGCEEFIVNRAVIGARIKEESDTTSLEKRQAETVALIQQALINRDMGKKARVVDSSRHWRIY